MPNYLVQATIWPTSNLLADASTNTWSIFANSNAILAGDPLTEIENVYKGMVSIFPNTVRQTGHTLKAYNRSDPEPRQPIAESVFDFTAAPGGAPLPPEVSICMSFQGVAISGNPQARRRGRVYFGPLRQDRVGTDGRPTGGLLDSVDAAGTGLLAASDAATAWRWHVWSTTDGMGVRIDNGWIDNEFDTQRRRGRIATARQTF